MTNDEKRELLDEIIALSSIQNIRPDDITIKHYMETAGCGYSAAKGALYLLVQEGTLYTTMVRGIGGIHTRVFRKVQQDGEM